MIKKEAKNQFYKIKNDQFQKLEELQKKLGACIAKAKPYYETLKLIEYVSEIIDFFFNPNILFNYYLNNFQPKKII